MSQGNRRAKFFLPMERIAQMMKMPDGVRPVFIYASSDPPGAFMVVECDEFPEQPPDATLPVLNHHLNLTVMTADDGRAFTHVECAKTAEDLSKLIPRPVRFA